MSRAFIIGNGKSLRRTPLEWLKNYDTWAVNKIRLIFPYTTWRPKYYVRTDDIYENADTGWEEDITEVLDQGATAYLGPMFYNVWKDTKYGGKIAAVMPICGEHVYHVPDKMVPNAWHHIEYCNFGGSLGVAIQLCARMGWYDEIYLLGCDLDYSDTEPCHFDPNYNNAAVTPYPASVIQADKIHAHEVAKKCSKVPIYNATIGGSLEVYPRVRLEDLCGSL